MDDMNIHDIMIELGRNYPEWINNGIGEQLNKMVKSLENIEKKQEKKIKSNNEDLLKSQQNQIKTADKVTRVSKDQLSSLNDAIKSMNNYKKVIDENTESESKYVKAKKKAGDLVSTEIKKREETLKSIETYNNILSKATNNIRNVRNMAVSMSTSLDRLDYANTIDKFGDTMSDVAESFGKVGGVVGAAILGVSQFAQVTIQHAQKLQTTYSTLNQSGLFLAGGLTNFADIAARTGMTLDSLGKVAGRSVSNVIMLGGDEGLGAIARMNDQMRDTESIFRKYGMTIEEINEYQADYLERERTLGMVKRQTEDQRLARMGAELQRFATLSTILGKSVKEIQQTGKDAVAVPETQAMLMQATRGLSKEDRQELQREIASIATSVMATGGSEEMVEIAKRQHIMNAANRYGNQVVSKKGTKSVNELRLMSPEIAAAIDAMSNDLVRRDMTNMSPEDIDKLSRTQEQRLLGASSRAYGSMQSGGMGAVMRANDISGGMDYLAPIFDYVTTMERLAISPEDYEKVRDNAKTTRESPIDPALAAVTELENLSNEAKIAWETGLLTIIKVFNKEDGLFQKFADGLETITDRVEAFSTKLYNIDPDGTFKENMLGLFGEDSSLAKAVIGLTENFKSLAIIVGGILAANAAITAIAGGSLLYKGLKKGGSALGKLFGIGSGAAVGGSAAARAGREVIEEGGEKLGKKWLGKQLGKKALWFIPGVGFALAGADAFNLFSFLGRNAIEGADDIQPVVPQNRTRGVITGDTQPSTPTENQIKNLMAGVEAGVNRGVGDDKIKNLLEQLQALMTDENFNLMLEKFKKNGVKIPAMESGGVALGPLLAQIGEGSSPEMVLPLDPAMSDLSKHISEQFIELVFPKFEHLQDKLIKTLFRDNRDVIDKTYTKSLDKFFFSKDDVMTSIKRHLSSTASEHDIEKRGLMQAMGNNVGGFEAGMLSSSTLGDMASNRSSFGNTSSGNGSGNFNPNGRKELEEDQSWNRALSGIKEEFPNLQEDDLYRLIQGESGFDPRARNASGATGLFQFMPDVAKELGVTTEQILRMSPAQQLKIYQKYLRKWNYKSGKLGILHAAPAFANRSSGTEVYRRGTAEWRQNPAWRGRDGRITVGSINSYYDKQARLKRKQNTSSPKATTQENPYTDNNGSIIEDDAPLNQISYDDLMPPPNPKVAPASKYNNDDGSGRSEISRILTSIDSKLDKLNRNMGNAQGKIFTA